MFIDTSVIVALLASEQDAGQFASRIADGRQEPVHLRTCHPGSLDASLDDARSRSLLDEAAISVVPINAGIAKRAVSAFARFGKGRGHPAQLNLADCLSYACAQAYRVPCCSGQ
jgi:ribonuclease VapC